jgi:hypothetical protein
VYYVRGKFGKVLEEDETNNGIALGPITVVQ